MLLHLDVAKFVLNQIKTLKLIAVSTLLRILYTNRFICALTFTTLSMPHKMMCVCVLCIFVITVATQPSSYNATHVHWIPVAIYVVLTCFFLSLHFIFRILKLLKEKNIERNRDEKIDNIFSFNRFEHHLHYWLTFSTQFCCQLLKCSIFLSLPLCFFHSFHAAVLIFTQYSL